MKIEKTKRVRGVSFDKSKNRWRVRYTSGARAHVWWTHSEMLAMVLAHLYIEQPQ